MRIKTFTAKLSEVVQNMNTRNRLRVPMYFQLIKWSTGSQMYVLINVWLNVLNMG